MYSLIFILKKEPEIQDDKKIILSNQNESTNKTKFERLNSPLDYVLSNLAAMAETRIKDFNISSKNEFSS